MITPTEVQNAFFTQKTRVDQEVQKYFIDNHALETLIDEKLSKGNHRLMFAVLQSKGSTIEGIKEKIASMYPDWNIFLDEICAVNSNLQFYLIFYPKS